MGGRVKCRTPRSPSRKCLDHMTSNPCRWIVMFVMCPHETSYVYSHECVKSSCFDENLVCQIHIRVFWTVSSVLYSKLVCSCVAYCEKSNKNRVGIVPHDLISMIHRLVLTNHLEDELT
jgi:hypothetical protein